MKKIILAVLGIFLVVCVALCFNSSEKPNSEFLRIHIRANSNSTVDQTVKYEVKAAVVEYLTPYIAQAYSKEQAMQIVESRLTEISIVADSVLKKHGFSYTSSAEICVEEFPTRSYNGVVLDSGFYDALILNLGEGAGNNWWCVVYPPLCFINGESDGTNSIQYKSKILEIIEKWGN